MFLSRITAQSVWCGLFTLGHGVQVSKQASFAFPLAAVAANVAQEHPEVATLLFGIIKGAEGSALCVPAFRVRGADGSSLSGTALQKANGLRCASMRCVCRHQPGGHALRTEGAMIGLQSCREAEEAKGQLEPMEVFLDRLKGTLRFYGALLQSRAEYLPRAWAFVASFLNHIHANRITATALLSFLETAGYAMFGAYRQQFVKLLAVIQADWLPELEQSAADAAAETTRLQSYCEEGFRRPPEGYNMPADVQAQDTGDGGGYNGSGYGGNRGGYGGRR